MKSFRHRLPPLNGLLIFEAAARHLNFTRAAEELHVTQAAVSRQIKQLETHLDEPLFLREGKRVQLSAPGRELQARVQAALEYLVDAVESVQKPQDRPVTLSANTAMSHFWLGPALGQFHAKYPDFDLPIRVMTSDHTEDLFAADIDLALIYDVGDRPGWTAQPLFEEELFPVAAPSANLCAPGPAAALQEWLELPLLDFERIEPNWVNWSIWLARHFAQTLPDIQAHASFNNYCLLIDAAIDGRGVALGTRHQITPLLKSKRLVQLGEASVKTGRYYYLSRPHHASDAQDEKHNEAVDTLARFLGLLPAHG